MFEPGLLPQGVQDPILAQYLLTELQKLSGLLNEIKEFQFAPLNVAPAKPREGMLVYADGVNWNPGATGAGLYRYTGGAWLKL